MKIDEEMYYISYFKFTALPSPVPTQLLDLSSHTSGGGWRQEADPPPLHCTYHLPTPRLHTVTHHLWRTVVERRETRGNQSCQHLIYLHNEDGRQIIIEVNQGYLCLMLFIYLEMLMDDICPSYIHCFPLVM